MLDLHIHDIDYILNAFGKVREVRSCGKQNITSAGSGIDYVLTQYITESPALIMAEGGWHFHSQFPFNMSFHVRCEKGTVVFDAGKQETLAIYTECGKTHIPPFSGITGWDEELKYFVNCVESGECTEASPPEESKAAVEIALMERESIRENNPMNIP